MRRLSAAITEVAYLKLTDHVIRSDEQEDLTFCLYRPSSGAERDSALLHELVLPIAGDREVHGNASFVATYFLRALGEAEAAGAGLALVHSHPHGRGWQGMSQDDVDTELLIAAQTWAVTGLPLVGVTVAGDFSCSARSWIRTAPSRFDRFDHGSVRVVGEQLKFTFQPELMPAPATDERMVRTVSAWGDVAQGDLARSHVCVVGLGSVGMLVAEALVRSGVRQLTLIDFDSVKPHNLDRLAHATRVDAWLRASKVEVARRALQRIAPFDGLRVRALELSAVEPAGLAAILDCDVVFSCVDRPWPRQLLDHVAFAHLIPVVDGGVLVLGGGELRRADWRAHVSEPSRRCLGCVGQYSPAEVALERAGDLDDPKYIANLSEDHPLRASENVFAFSTAVASLEVLQFLSLLLAPSGIGDVGEWNFHFVTGRMDVVQGAGCGPHCPHRAEVAQGSQASAPTAVHPAADQESAARANRQRTARARGLTLAQQMLLRAEGWLARWS